MKTRVPGLSGLAAVIVLCTLCAGAAYADKQRYKRHYQPYRDYYPEERFELRQDMRRLRDQIERQQRQIERQVRLQQEQTRLLRQQASTRNRLSAMQACYYRLNAGLDLCEDLFDTATKEYAACLEKVGEKNPGCAGDAIRPGTDSRE